MTNRQKAVLRRIVLDTCQEAAGELVLLSGRIGDDCLVGIPQPLSISHTSLKMLAVMAGFGDLSDAFNEASPPSPPGG